MYTPKDYQPAKAGETARPRRNAAVFMALYKGHIEGSDEHGLYCVVGRDIYWLSGSQVADEIRKTDTHNILSDRDVIDAAAQVFRSVAPTYSDPWEVDWSAEGDESGPNVWSNAT